MLHGHPTIKLLKNDNDARRYGLKIGQRAYFEAGVNFGKTPYVVESLPDPVKGPYHIICVPGHTGWCSLGNTSYYETHYALLEEWTLKDKWKCHAHDRKFGRKWREGIKQLREEAEALMRGTTKAHEEAKRVAKALDENDDIPRLQSELQQLYHEKDTLNDTISPLTNNIKALNEARRVMGNAVFDTENTLRNLHTNIEKKINRINEITRIFKLRKEK